MLTQTTVSKSLWNSFAKAIGIAAIALAASTQANAQSITTVFSSNNAGSAGGGVYFDITVGANPISITGFDVNTTALSNGLIVPFRAWTTVAGGTSVGNQANPLAWTQVASGSGIGAGLNLPTAITLGGSFILNANTTYGMALSLSDGTGVNNRAHAYSGTGANPAPGALQYVNADLTLNLGSATNVLFSGTPFSPRIWNGTIYYSVVPAPGALALLGLAGLVGGSRRRRA